MIKKYEEQSEKVQHMSNQSYRGGGRKEEIYIRDIKKKDLNLQTLRTES